MDSGATGNFIDQQLVMLHSIPLETLETPLSVHGVDGALLAAVRYSPRYSQMQVGATHGKEIQFLTCLP